MLPSLFTPAGTYLDTATYGLPPRTVVEEMARVTASWADGSYRPADCDAAIARARSSFARLHGVAAQDVAIGHQVSPLVGVVAGSLGRGTRVLAADGEFTSLLFPFLAAGCEVTTVALEHLPEAITAATDLVAVSAVQSADGRLAALDAIAEAARAHGALTLIDGTQACGWMPIDGSRFDALIAGGYKWLLQPRGTAFAYLSPALRERLVPSAAGWFAGSDPWETCYGLPLRLAADARRFDVSPAWLCWHAAAVSLALLEETGIERIHTHDVALAARLREGLGLAESDSAIVSLAAGPAAVEALERAGVRASVRAGRARLSCHLYNDEADVDRALEALAHGGPAGGAPAGRVGPRRRAERLPQAVTVN